MGFLRIIEISSLITTIIGLYLLGEKNSFGFILHSVSVACQSYIFYKNKNWFLIVQMAILFVFNIWNYIKWGVT
jgi:hypothetical protein